jgi:DNA-binding MarR family transcriptional regulator
MSDGRHELSVLVADVFDALNLELMTRLDARDLGHLKSTYRVVFRSIGEAGGSVAISDLARDSGVTTQAISHVIREMSDLGLVHRTPDPDDGRVFRVSLTAAGRRTFAKVSQIHAEFEREWRQLLGARRASEMKTALLAVREHLSVL